MIKKLYYRSRRYQLTARTIAAIAIIILVTIYVLYKLSDVSLSRARALRGEVFERDLRELAGRFDADERYVLAKNIRKLIEDSRAPTPLILPRQYYVSFPSKNSALVLPRQPPRNCFVSLWSEDLVQRQQNRYTTKVCSYFSENKSPGKYLFLALNYSDDSIIPLKQGDISFSADLIQLSVTHRGKSQTWWLGFQNPQKNSAREQYELTAFRLKAGGIKERDRRLEGWAYVQKQATGTPVINLIARLDFKEFMSSEEIQNEDAVWPPDGWEDVSIRLTRRDASTKSGEVETIVFQERGKTNYSIPSLGAAIFNAHAKLAVESTEKGVHETWDIKSPVQFASPEGGLGRKIQTVNGDLLISWNPQVQKQSVPETNIVFKVTHPGTVIEQGFWQAVLYLFLLVLFGLIAAWHFFTRLLRPIAILSRDSKRLISLSDHSIATLPYSHQSDEIGVLSSSFNELLDETRKRATREHAEKLAREETTRQRQLEEVQRREENLNIIGHEIRSPLQALMSIYPSGETRRYLDRIYEALPHLLGSAGAQAAFDARVMNIEPMDIADFLREVSQNILRQIPDVVYIGPKSGIYCAVDDGAIEDAISHILSNAERYRVSGSEIKIHLFDDSNSAVIRICNDGPSIDEEIKDRIFDYKFTTVRNSSTAGQGLGLFVAKKYIKRMGGSIEAINTATGVCLQLSLPLLSKE